MSEILSIATKEREIVRALYSSSYYNAALFKLGTTPTSVTQTEYLSYTRRRRPLSNWCAHWLTDAFLRSTVQAQHRDRTYRYLESAITDSFWKAVPNPTQSLTTLDNESSFAVLKERAITDVLSGGKIPRVDVPLFIAELKDAPKLISTLVMAARDAKRVYGYLARANALYRALQSGSPRQLSKADEGLLAFKTAWDNGVITIKRAADVNLWYKFGLAPLISDIPKLWRCLNKTQIDVRPKTKESGDLTRAKVTYDAEVQLRGIGDQGDKTVNTTISNISTSGTYTLSSAGYIGNASLKLSSRRYSTTEHRLVVYGHLHHGCLKPGGRSVLESIKLGAGGPLSLAWELTRLSFLFDRLLDIGTFLKQTEQRLRALDLGLEFTDGVWLSHGYDYCEVVPWWEFTGSTLSVVTRTASAVTYKDSHRYTWRGWQKIAGSRVFERTQLSSIQPRFVIRHNSNLTNLLRLDTDLALLVQLLTH